MKDTDAGTLQAGAVLGEATCGLGVFLRIAIFTKHYSFSYIPNYKGVLIAESVMSQHFPRFRHLFLSLNNIVKHNGLITSHLRTTNLFSDN